MTRLIVNADGTSRLICAPCGGAKSKAADVCWACNRKRRRLRHAGDDWPIVGSVLLERRARDVRYLCACGREHLRPHSWAYSNATLKLHSCRVCALERLHVAAQWAFGGAPAFAAQKVRK